MSTCVLAYKYTDVSECPHDNRLDRLNVCMDECLYTHARIGVLRCGWLCVYVGVCMCAGMHVWQLMKVGVSDRLHVCMHA